MLLVCLPPEAMEPKSIWQRQTSTMDVSASRPGPDQSVSITILRCLNEAPALPTFLTLHFALVGKPTLPLLWVTQLQGYFAHVLCPSRRCLNPVLKA